MVDLDAEKEVVYNFNLKTNGLYIFVLEGCIEAGGQTLERRDGLGVFDTDAITLKATADASVLLMEVPLQL